MFEKEKNDDVIEKSREASIFEAAWERASNMEGTSAGNAPYRQLIRAISIFNESMDAEHGRCEE